VNTDRAAAEFDAVHHHVIVLAADFFRVAVNSGTSSATGAVNG